MTKYPILAIDYGEKNFGLAISDSKGIVASPLKTLSISKRTYIEDILEKIVEIIQENRVKTILLGYPQIFSQNQQKTLIKIDKFREKLSQNTELPILLYDESFSTTTAQNMLTSTGQNTKSSRPKIDKIAATVFLQEFLNSNQKKNA
jgi:putative Holliday junction resolvase